MEDMSTVTFQLSDIITVIEKLHAKAATKVFALFDQTTCNIFERAY